MVWVVFNEEAACILQDTAGKKQKVICLPMYLSLGKINADNPYDLRCKVVTALMSIYPQADQLAKEVVQSIQQGITCLKQAFNAGEDILVWYSDVSGDLCGVYWVASQILHQNKQCKMYITKLPYTPHVSSDTFFEEDIVSKKVVQLLANAAVADSCSLAEQWEELKQQDADMRAVVNGKLISAPITLYDSYIWKLIDEQPPVFCQAVVVGGVIGRYNLGITDKQVALRMQQFINDKKLKVVKHSLPDEPIYYQYLQKVLPDGEIVNGR